MLKKILALISILLLTGCTGREPNDAAYVVALGIDKANEDNYEITIQFARPAQISGGEEGSKGGSGIVENISVEAPDIYSAMNLANNLISKQFSLSHAKVIVFSEETARDGIKDIIETLSRSDEIRPDLITAVSRETAQEYLENTKPIVEVNPTKYYQLIYEKNVSGGIPKMSGIEVMSNIMSSQRDSVMPLAGVAEGSEKNSSGGSGEGSSESEGSEEKSVGGEEQSENSGSSNESTQGSTEQEQEKEDKNVPESNSGYQYKNRNYMAGQVKMVEEKKSEALGMALFKGDRLIAELGTIDADIYNILTGEYRENYTSFYTSLQPEKPVTVRLNQRKKPLYNIDKKNKRLEITLDLEGNFYSLPFDFNLESQVTEFEKNSADEISRHCTDFVRSMRDDYDADVLGIAEKAKKHFIDIKSYEEYNWKKNFKEYDIKVNTKFKIRHSGVMYRE